MSNAPAAPRRSSPIIDQQTIISAIASALISIAIFALLFRGATIDLGPASKFPADFLIQAFAVGFFAAFVPTLVVSTRIKKGELAGTPRPLPRLALHAVLWGLGAAALLGLPAFLITQSLNGQLAWAIAALVKIALGALIAILVTPRALQPLLS